jgi:steroid 5-alpha reductase family enzyme
MNRFIFTDPFLKLFSGPNIQFQNLVSTWIILMISVAILCFLVSEMTRNYSQVDKLWSLIPIAYSWITVMTVPTPRLILMASLVTIWGLRLSYNFYRKGGYNILPWRGEEDYRWKVMRETSALKGRFRFGLFNLIFISIYQNILILLISTPLLMAALHAEKQISFIDIASGVFILGFIITEGIADNQLFRFHTEKKQGIVEGSQYKESLGKGFFKEGLWKYSRHPNFACEQGIWISFYFFGVGASGVWINLTLAGPILLVLLFIGSSQLTERISSEKYSDYKVYKKEVPRFIPGILKRQTGK